MEDEMVGDGKDVALRLTADQTNELGAFLDEVLGDLSTEIAATENPSFRAGLERRRDVLHRLRTALLD